jgi:uncharacterized protein with von Willebrand factor type A (vWA) domain
MSKGSKQRPTDKEAFDAAFDRIFGAKPKPCGKCPKDSPYGSVICHDCLASGKVDFAPVEQKKERKEKDK